MPWMAGHDIVRAWLAAGGRVSVDGKGFMIGLALLLVILAVLFGVALSGGAADDGGGEDCVSQEFC